MSTLVIPGGNRPEILEAIEATFHDVAALVEVIRKMGHDLRPHEAAEFLDATQR